MTDDNTHLLLIVNAIVQICIYKMSLFNLLFLQILHITDLPRL